MDSSGQAAAVRAAFEHAWGAYEKHAFGKDELKPVSCEGEDSFSGLGVTLVDSLDTMLLMGLMPQFKRARNWVAEHFLPRSMAAKGRLPRINVFETTIRVVGGLISAYDLSGDAVLLEKAVYLVDRILPAFNTSTGIPFGEVDLNSGLGRNPQWTSGFSILSEAGSLQ
eukprot:gene12293-14519_t